MTTQAAAILAAARAFAAARAERDALGTRAAARWARPNGTDEDQAALAEYLHELQQRAAEHTPAA